MRFLFVLAGWLVFCGIMAWKAWPKNRRCPKCGFQASYAKFCHYDGTKMVRAKRQFLRCKKCRKEIWKSDEFCNNCGEKR